MPRSCGCQWQDSVRDFQGGLGGEERHETALDSSHQWSDSRGTAVFPTSTSRLCFIDFARWHEKSKNKKKKFSRLSVFACICLSRGHFRFFC